MNTNDQNESGLPLSNADNRATANLLPRFYRTDSNKKFLQSTLDQLTQPGQVKKVNGFIGKQNAKAVTSSDIFLNASDTTRQNYQLEPSAVIQDYLGNTTFYKDYIDHINHIDVLGGNVANHERLNAQEFYSWNPNIDWDKFVNYQNYYWLPYGPTPISVTGQQQSIESTYTIEVVDEEDNYAFVFNPDGLTKNPTITLYRGQTYKFNITSPGNPFSIKTQRVAGALDRYTSGVSASAIETGEITFVVGELTPDVLYYVSENSIDTGGVIQVLDINENTYLNVDADIVGKKTYTLESGISLSNGMKLKFEGNVAPELYSSSYWYVEGVGTAIKLISEYDLEIITNYSEEQTLLFDDGAFDQTPFSTASSFPQDKDYVLIARGSPDRNQWSRYNRWFHQDIITTSAVASNQTPEFNQSLRAIRPIIEFTAGLKLVNFGHKSKLNVDLIDTFTTDVFSTVEGSLGYNIDGVDVANGMRVLFTADTDSLVKNKIFKVNFLEVTVPGRQVEFLALTGVQVNDNVITCSTPHGLTTGNQVLYLNNGNLNISGLINRQVYYVSVVNETQLKIYKNKLLTVPAVILATGSSIHKLEVFSGLRRQINLTEEADTTPLTNETVLIKQGIENQGRMYWFNGTTWHIGQEKTAVNQAPLFDIFDDLENSYGNTSIYDGSTFAGTKLFSYKVGNGTNDSELGFPLSYQNINNIGDISFNFDLLNDSFSYKKVVDVTTKNTNVGFLKLVVDLDRFTYVNGWKTSLIPNVQPVVRIFKESGIVNSFPIDVYDNITDLADLEVKVYVNGKRVPSSNYSIVDGSIRKRIVFNTDVLLTDVVTLKCFAKQSKNNNGYYEVPINFQNNPLNDNLSSFTLGQVIDHVDSIVNNLSSFSGNFPGTSNLRDLGNVTPYGSRFVQHSGPMNLSLYHLGIDYANVFKALDQARNDYNKFKRAFILAAFNSSSGNETKKHVDDILSTMLKDTPKTNPYYLSDMFGYSGSNVLEYTVLDSRTKTYPLTAAFSLSNLSNKSVNVYLNGVQLVEGIDYKFGTDIFFEILIDLTEGDIIEAVEYESTDGSFCPATPTKLGLYPKFEPKKYLDNTYLEPTEVIRGHDGSITIAFGDYRDDLLLELEKRIFNNIKVQYDSTIFDIYDYVPNYSRNTAYSKSEFEACLAPLFYQWSSTIDQDYTKQLYFSRLEPFTFNYRGNSAPDGTEVPAFWRGVYSWFLDTDSPHTHPWECLGFSIEPAWWQTVYGAAPYTSDNFLVWDDIRQGIVREPGVPLRRLEKFAKPVLGISLPVDEDGNLQPPAYTGYVTGEIKATNSGYFVFGDQGPVEAAWRKSSYYPFALIQTALLLTPNKVLGTCLDRSRITKNLSNQYVYSETGLRLRLADIVLPSTASSESRVITSGLINYIIDYMTSDSNVLIMQYQTDLVSLTNRLGSKLGGFTSKSKFRLLLDSKSPTSTGGVFVPEENYNIVLNTSSAIKKVVYSGVIITKYTDGYEIRGYQTDSPVFKYYPWKETRKTINIGGISESFINWDSGKLYSAGKIIKYNNQYYRVNSTHTSSDTLATDLVSRLAALPVNGGRDINIRKSWDTSYELSLSYGTKLETVQDVADFIQGYGAYLEAQGFVFDDFNTELKAISNWETSVNEFVFWSTQNWGEGAVLSMSPAANNLVLKTTASVVNDIQDEFYGYKIFRVDGQKLEPEFTNVYRSSNEFSLAPSRTEHGIFGAVLYLIQKEHVLILDNTTLFNDIVYDLEPGYRQERIKVLGYISQNWNGGFNIPGFIFDQATIQDWTPWTDYKLGDIVKYKEFYYSATSSLIGVETFNDADWSRLLEKPTAKMTANWDYQAEQFTDFYDLDTDNFNAEQQKFAQHLIAYQKRQYLENIIQDDVSQYKFYQGMIIEKGTQNVLNKLFDVLSADNMESLTFNEEWAVRVGDYGATAAFDEIEFVLDESQFKINPQPVELVTSVDVSVNDFVYRQIPNDVYIKPVGYNNNPWPIENTPVFLRSPGYVRYENVKLYVDVLSDATQYDISTFKEGDYVWCAFENRDWNIYRFTKLNFSVDDVEYSNGVLTLVCDRIPEVQVGDVIGIENVNLIKGFYTIDAIQNKNIIINTKVTGWTKFEDSSQILLYTFVTSRTSNIDEANNVIPYNIKTNELLWADTTELGSWAVYTNSKVYTATEFTSIDKSTNLHFGKKVSISQNGNISVVTDNNKITIFNKVSPQNTWIESQVIVANLSNADTVDLVYGKETALSADGKWLAISAPYASYVKTNWQGQFNPSSTYAAGSVVGIGNTHWTNKQTYNGDGSTVDRFSQDWEPVSLITVDTDGNASSFSKQGYVELYERLPSGLYVLSSTFVSPAPTTNELFGSKLVFAQNGDEYILAVSSAGYNSAQGRVYMFRYSASLWHMDYDRNYAGMFDENRQDTLGNPKPYQPGDIVFYNYELYRCLSEQDLAPFDATSSAWELLTDNNILGYFPQETVTNVSDGSILVQPTANQTVESVLAGDLFGYDIALNSDGTRLVISAPAADQTSYNNYKGKYRTTAQYDRNDVVYYIDTYYKYNLSFDSSVAGAFNPANWTELETIRNVNTGKVFVYDYTGTGYTLVDTLGSQNLNFDASDRFGESVALSSSGNYLAVGSTLTDNTKINQGKVLILEADSGTYSPMQEIFSPKKELNEQYGARVAFMNNDNTLAVFSAHGDVARVTVFDSENTTFDNATARIVDRFIDAGRLDIYDRYNTKFVFGESLDSSSGMTDSYGYSIAIANNIILAAAPYAFDVYRAAGKIYSYTKPSNAKSWTVLHYERPRPNISKIKKAYLYDQTTSELITYLDIVDPVQGKIPGIADQEIKYKTYFDPATYSVGSAGLNVDNGMNWTRSQVGMLWWDLTRAKFLENQGGEVVYRSSTWNKLYDTASIDIYEWVETKYLPSEWDKLADTEKGLTLGISGTSKYGDAVYSVKKKYDNISQKFTNTYYYWIKNKTLVPSVTGRTLAASDVSRLISDPSSYGYTCLAITGSNSFSLVNVGPLLDGKNVALNVQYWIVDNQENNTHSQWKIISEHPNTTIPKNIENKWIDSLIGKDDNDRVIPDLNLPIKQRYGIEFRPRQGMFVNRVEALKQLVDRVNDVLATKLIVDDTDLTDLNSADIAPTTVSGLWDTVIDTEEELRFIGTANLTQAAMTPVIENGLIVGVTVTVPGFGYVNPPFIKVIGAGTDAVLKAVLGTSGEIVGVEILNAGYGYTDETMLSVRAYSVLVSSDTNSFDKWSVYAWNKATRTWDRSRSQAYDVTKFWQYIDWYATGYNQFVKIDHLVENTYQLVTLSSAIGNIVKVKNIGSGGWVLLEKYNDLTTIDYTLNYKVVGRQNGTIEFLSSLYTFSNSAVGFDNQLFDAGLYDNFAAKELRIIINAIKNKILVDDLKVEYLKLFFASLRYVMHEQIFIDWAFKTSFVKATHNVGDLKEKVTYNNDNLSNFEDYINEVKPYRTKIREYVSSYSKTEYANQSVTDFDVPPTINNNLVVAPITLSVTSTGTIESSSADILTYPWKHWYDHVGFTLQTIDIVNGGSGYIGRPIVKIEGGFGTGATATAFIANGSVNRIELLTSGSGYLKAPTIVIDGGLDIGGVAATAVATIETEVVRANKISIKFDRISSTYLISELTQTETFVGTGSQLQFPLRWSPSTNIGSASIKIYPANINPEDPGVTGVDALRGEYTLSTKKSTTRGYTSYSGLLTLDTAPAVGEKIRITYEKNFNHMSATDRINYFYNPASGMLGATRDANGNVIDFAQLMTGIDYGGVQITGLGFGVSGGWDALPWFSDSWDGFDAQFDDYIVTVSDSTYAFELPYIPAVDEEINIYVNGVRIDDPYFDLYDGVTVQPNGLKIAPTSVVMQTFVGNGIINTIELPNLTSETPIDINANDKIIFRKSTSDGSFLPRADEYDTQLSGGAFNGTALLSATGYAPDDINIDGDGLVTPSTSHAPEEVVPGHISDALAIKVFHRPTGGAPKMLFKNYIANGATSEFVIGQYFPTERSVIVKVGDSILENTEYVINWATNSVEVNSTPLANTIVSIISFGFNSENILDLDYFIADGSTVEYVTKAPWLDSTLASTVLVDGNVIDYSLFRTDETYHSPDRVGIRFGEAVTAGSIINYMIDTELGDSTTYQTSSVVKSQTIVFDGSTQTYDLENLGSTVLPGYKLAPYETNMIVRKGQEILKPSTVIYFTMENDNLTYNIPNHKFEPYGVDAFNIRIFANGVYLLPGRDYVLDLFGINVEISIIKYVEGAKLAIVFDVGAEYTIQDNGTITFADTYAEGTEIEIITFYNHTVLDVDRTVDIMTPAVTLVPDTQDYFEFTGKLGSRFILRKPAKSDEYVWVIKNGTLLTHSVDYALEEDYQTVKLKTSLIATDTIQVMSFNGIVVQETFGFMQFKDMLNRVHYKRLRKDASTTLTANLLQSDIEISVADGTVLAAPNPALNLPGIVEINGERIEYFTKVGNVLGQLRRGTLGTGVPTVHAVGEVVQDIGPTETIPYADQTVSDTVRSDGSTNAVNIRFVPGGFSTDWTYQGRNLSNEEVETLASNAVDVFVGGYRLKKVPYVLFEATNNYPYSPTNNGATEGNTQYTAEFTVTGVDSTVTIAENVAQKLFATSEVPEFTKISVIKKLGKIWNDPGKSLGDSDNNIANFLKKNATVWPR
jgi:hypothetical protein